MSLFSKDRVLPAVTPLLNWYDQNKREMAWRSEVSPYRTWVSEIMLQQTRVEAVRAYFDRWMKALPTVSDLANADSEELAKLWEGLGYYSRVRNLQKAARIVMDDFGGFLPNERKTLLSLPGIGEYTAGAILSIAFGQRAAAVDGNVIRVFARFLDIREIITDDKHKRQLGEMIEAVMPEDRTADFTQALMELGALVCIPAHPRCEVCPWKEMCQGYAHGVAETLPVLPAKAEKKVEKMSVVVICDANANYYLRKRGPKGLLAGLWEPYHCQGYLSAAEIEKHCQALGWSVQSVEKLGSHTHIFTHKKWVMKGYLLHGKPKGEEFVAVSRENLRDKYALPKAFAPFFKEG